LGLIKRGVRDKRRYGARRIREELKAEGLAVSEARIRRLMAKLGLKAIQPKTYVPQTSDGRADAPSPNIVASEPQPTKPNQVLLGDITFIPTEQGWLYLAVVIDLFSRCIVGWSLADHMRSQLVEDALKQALGSRRIEPGAVFHSDRGSQYGSKAFRSILAQAQMRQSMSGRANPYDNAWTESTIGRLKAEMLQGGSFIDEKDARTEIFAYINGYYNTHRRHSSIGYLAPLAYEAIQAAN
jgi:putative transposase